jgi:excisionase family DNA binding protein
MRDIDFAGASVSITREDVLTVADVAALLDLKPYTVKEYARRGILPGRKLGRAWRFLRPELEQAISHLPTAGERTRNRHRPELRS